MIFIILVLLLDIRNSISKEDEIRIQKENSKLKKSLMTAIQAGKIKTIDGYITTKAAAKYLRKITENPDISCQRTAALLSQLSESKKLEKSEIRTKSGKVNGYKIIKSS